MRLEIRDKIGAISCVVGLSRVAIEDGDTYIVVKLSGAADALFNSIHAKMDVDVGTLHSQTILNARAALVEETFNAAWDERKELSLDEATTLALEFA